MIKLTASQIIKFQAKLIEKTGGLAGIKDKSLIDSSLNAPFQTWDGVDLYPTTLEKIIRIGYNLIRNHCFADGNKRIGMYAMLILLELNQFEIELSDEDIIFMGINVASGEMSYEELIKYICGESSSHDKNSSNGENSQL